MIRSPIHSSIDRVRAYLIAELCNDALTATRELSKWYADGLQLADSIAHEQMEGVTVLTLKKKHRERRFRTFVDFDQGKRARKFLRFGPRNNKPPKRRA